MKLLSFCGFALLASYCVSNCTSELNPELEPDLQSELKILMIGNSHTQTNDLHITFADLLGKSQGKRATVKAFFVSDLDQARAQPDINEAIVQGRYDIVVLQAQKISMSHKYTYDTSAAKTLANRALGSGADTYFFAEWPRRGIVETKYVEDIYKGIAAQSQVQVLPNGQVWDELLKGNSKLELWVQDGNHSSQLGAYVAAANMAYWINGGSLKDWSPPKGVVLDGGLKESIVQAIESVYKRNHLTE